MVKEFTYIPSERELQKFMYLFKYYIILKHENVPVLL